MRAGFSEAIVTATSREKAASSKQGTQQPRVPASRPTPARSSCSDDGGGGSHKSTQGTQRASPHAALVRWLLNRGPAIYFFKDNFLGPLGNLQLLLPFPPAPTFASSARPGDAQAQVPIVWPGRPQPGCVCGAAIHQQQPVRGEWRGVLPSAKSLPPLQWQGGDGGGDGRARVRTGSWRRGDL